MEATSFGCPIISSNVGIVADLIDDRKTGTLCTKIAEEISKEIFFLWCNPGLLTNLSQNSFTKTSKEFTIDKIIQRHSNLKNSLLV